MGRRTVNERLTETNAQVSLALAIAVIKLGGKLEIKPKDLEAVRVHRILVKEDKEKDIAVITIDPPAPTWLQKLFGAK